MAVLHTRTAKARAFSVLALLALLPLALGAQAGAGLTGVYTGTYRCGQGTTPLKLSLAMTPAGEVTGHFTFFLPPGTQNQAYTYTLYGQFNPATAKFSLIPVGWETGHPANMAMVGMNGTWDSNELTGTITGAGCTTFQVERDRAQPSRAAPSSASPVARAAAAPAQPAPAPAPVKVPAGARPPAEASRQANLDAVVKKIEQIEANRAADENPVLKWQAVTKKDSLTDNVSTLVTAYYDLSAHGRNEEDAVSINAICNPNGVSIFFALVAFSRTPVFNWYQDQAEPVADVRMRVDGGGVHVAKGYPDKKGGTYQGNSLGLLFYKPGLTETAAREQAHALTTGISAFDNLIGPLVQQAADANAREGANSSAGPMSDLLNARSIRVALPILGYDDEPVVDLNPQDRVLHQFASACSDRISGATQPQRAAPATAVPATPRTDRSRQPPRK